MSSRSAAPVRWSEKQRQVLGWWRTPELRRRYDAIICDGAVRSGKTTCTGLSFLAWALCCQPGQDIALCGKTIRSLRRNLAGPLFERMRRMGIDCRERFSENYADLTWGSRSVRVYLFGGRDESSASLIQGMTLAGVLFDEVALMPRSFVEQALARCSVEGATFWFSCNPEHPEHWFYKEWIQKAEERRALYLHFTMQDNPALSPQVIRRYERMYTGRFYERFVLGEWTAPEGQIYDMFSAERHVAPAGNRDWQRLVISCDYGTVNPMSMGLWGSGTGYGTACGRAGMTPGPRAAAAPMNSTMKPSAVWQGSSRPNALKRWSSTHRLPASSNAWRAIGYSGWCGRTTGCGRASPL